MSSPLSFIHRFEKGVDITQHPILLLHGTSGDGNDLVSLGRSVAPGAPLLSPCGKVLENGMPRFFRRLGEKVFDEDDVRRRADELADFIDAARKHYGIALPVALGYSNGANIAAATMSRRPTVLSGAILLRVTLPVTQPAPADLTGVPVLIASGARNPIMSPEGPARLAAMLQRDSALVEHRIYPRATS
jgi:phospholipase/carboxylesterase